MIKKLSLAFSFAFALMLSSIQAQKIAIVDITDVLENMSEFKEAEQTLDKIAADWQQEIAQELDKVKSMYNKYQAEQVLLSDDIKKSREDEIMNKEKDVRELQRRKFGPEGELFQKRQQLVSPVQDLVFSAIEEYADEKGYDIVLDKSAAAGILFASDEYDKTDIVKKKLGIR